MKLTKINFECDECGFVWRAPIWEPLWVSKFCFQEIHADQHAIGNGSTHPLVAAWLKWEQERIIKLLEGYFKPEDAKTLLPANYEQYLDIIELIKGEQK